MKEILSIIPARGGSKRLPKKNIRNFCGEPLLSWTIRTSLASKLISRTVVSSEDERILEIAKKYGSEVIKRPKQLALSHSKTEPVLIHVLNYLKKKENYFPDFIILLQPTSPLRKTKDVDDAINLLIKKRADSLISVYKLSFNPLKFFIIGRSGFLKSISDDKYPFTPAQKLPNVYASNGAIYVVKTKLFLKTQKLFSKKTVPFIMDEKKSVDIDTISDFKNAENLFIKYYMRR